MTASYHSATMASFQEEVADIQLETTSTSDFKWNEQAFGVVGGSDRAIDEVLDQAYRERRYPKHPEGEVSAGGDRSEICT